MRSIELDDLQGPFLDTEIVCSTFLFVLAGMSVYKVGDGVQMHLSAY
jgi:hypothetical protein